jgi:hypothetical protein
MKKGTIDHEAHVASMFLLFCFAPETPYSVCKGIRT